MQSILTGLEAARFRRVAGRRWGLAARVTGGGGERGLQGINATVGPQSSHPPLVCRWQGRAQPYPSRSGELTSAIKVRKNWNRARLVEVGLS